MGQLPEYNSTRPRFFAVSLVDGIVALALFAGLIQNTTPAISVAALLLVIVWGTSRRLAKGLGFKKTEWAIVICLLYWLASYMWSTADIHNLFSLDFPRHDGSILVSYTAFLGLLAWPLRPRALRAFWFAFLTALSLAAIPGVVISLHLPHPLFFEDLGLVKWDATLQGPVFYFWYNAHNTAGGVYALASLISLTLIQEGKVQAKGKMYLWFLMVCCMGGLASTFSRGGYLAFVFGALFLIPIKKLGRVFKAGLLIGVPVLLILTLTSRILNRVDTITDPTYGTNAARLDIWSEAWEDFTLSPIVGIGFGRFNDERVEFKGIKHFVWVGVHGVIVNNDTHAHNSYLHFLAEGGIIGLWVSMAIWWYAWKELAFFERNLRKSSLHWLYRAAKACLVGVLVQSLTEHVLGRASVLLILLAVLGPTIAVARLEWAAAQRATARKPAFEGHREPVAVAQR